MGGSVTPIPGPYSLRLQHAPLPSSQGTGKGYMRNECTARIGHFTATPVAQSVVILLLPSASPLSLLLKESSHSAVTGTLVSWHIFMYFGGILL